MPARVSLVLLALSLTAAPLCAQGRLDAVRDEVRRPPVPDDSSSSDDPEEGVASALFSGFLGALFDGEGDSGGEPAASKEFAPYPYFGGYEGLMWLPDGGAKPPDSLGAIGGRVLIDDANDFGGLNRLGGQVFLDTSCGLGLRAGYQWLRERLPCGCTDDMGLGDVNVLVRLIGTEHVVAHVGVGCAFLSDCCRTDAGVNFTASCDIFPVKPVVFSAQFDVAPIGSATLTHARATVGYLWRRWEAFGGYDHLQIGSANLGGPVAGLRLWF